MGTRNLGFVASLAFVCMLLVAVPARAADTGFNQTAAGPWDYNASGNWVGGTINGIWHTSLTLTAAQTVTFADDTLLGTGWTFNYGGNQTLTLRSNGTADRLVTLGGDISASPAGASNQTVTIGSTTADQRLNIELGATRTFTVASGDTLALLNIISGAGFGITKEGAGTLTLSGANTFSGGVTLNAGRLFLGPGTYGAGSGPLGTGTFTINGGAVADNGGTSVANAVVINASCGFQRSGGTLTFTGPVTINNPVTLNVGVDAGFTVHFSGAVTDNGNGVTLMGPAQWGGSANFNVNNAATLTGGITLHGGASDIRLYAGANTVSAFGSGTTVTAASGTVTVRPAGVGTQNVVLNNHLRVLTDVTIGGNYTYTMNGDIIMGANRTLRLNDGYGGTLTFNGALVNDGSGTYTATIGNHPSNNNTFAFAGSSKTHTAGFATGTYVTINVSGANNTFGAPVTVGTSTGTVNVTGTGNSFSGGLVSAGGTLSVASTATGTTFGQYVKVQGGRVLIGTATAPTFSPGTVVTLASVHGSAGLLGLAYNGLPPIASSPSGVLAINNAAYNQSLSGLAGTDVYIGSTATGTYTGTALPTTSGAYLLGGGGGTLTLDVPASTTGVLTGANSVVVGRNGGGTNFAGVLVLRDNNAFTGSITVNRGSTLTADVRDLPAGPVTPFGSTTGDVTLNGGTLSVTTGTATGGARTITKGVLTVNGTGLIALTGSASAPAEITFGSLSVGAGAANTGTSSVLLMQGAAALGGNDRIKVTSAPTVTNGMVTPYIIGNLAFTAADFMTYDATVGFRATLNYTARSGTFTPALNEISNVTGGSAVMNAGSPYAFKVNDVSLTIAADATVTVGSGGVLWTASGGRNLSAGNANSTLDFGSNEGVIHIRGGSVAPFVRITGTNGFIKFGTGAFQLDSLPTTNPSTISGTITVVEGSLFQNSGTLTWANIFPNIDKLVLNGGMLHRNDRPTTLPSSLTITIGPNGGTLLGTGNEFTINGPISGTVGGVTGLLTLDSNATLNSAANNYAGGTLISKGTINVAAASSLGTGAVTMAAGTLNLNGSANIASTAALTVMGGATANFQGVSGQNTPSIGSLAGAGSVVLGPSSGTVTCTLTVGGDNTSTEFYGVISNRTTTGIGALTKVGTGTLTLAGANTYTGGTTINGGTLVAGHADALGTTGTITVNSGGKLAVGAGVTFSRPFTLNSGGKIGGNGTFAQSGGVTVGSNRYLDPGMSVGATTFATGLTINGGIYTWEIATLDTVNPGTSFDIAYVTGGDLTITGSSALTLVFGTGLAPNQGDTFWNTARTWKIIDFSGSGTSTGNFASITNGTGWGNGVFTVSRSDAGPDSGDIFLNWVVPPVANAGGPYTCPYGGTVNIWGNASGGMPPYTFAWDLDNNNVFETPGKDQSLSYGALIAMGLAPGANNPINLRVTDSQSLWDDDTAQLYLDPLQIPVVDAGGPYTCSYGGSVNISGSVLSGGMAPFTFEWDLDNDGNYDDALGVSFSRTYVQLLGLGITPGVPVNIGLRVTDTYGAWNTDTATLLLTAPVAEPAGLSLIGLALLGLKRRRRS